MQLPLPRTPRTAQRAEIVEARIGDVLAGIGHPGLREAARHAIAGGKRIRPLLAMVACAAAGGEELSALDPAVAVEMLHTASLVHDDIMDGSDLRRGRPTLHALHGTSAGILTGDTLVAAAFRLLSHSTLANRNDIMAEFSSAYLHLCEGQSDDIALSPSEPLDAEHHREMVRKKTGELVGCALAMGALSATRRRETIESLRRFGILLGMAYQAKDDLLEITGREEVAGKRLGTDVRNGRRTYLTMAYPEIDAAASVSGLVSEYTGRALRELCALPESSARDELERVARLLANRDC
jgi:geranylgeranyl pyrophosphate synthase